MILIRVSIVAALAFSASFATAERAAVADVVVYGGTASGVMTAYAAGREGLKVVLLEPGAHLGGMVTGGLSATDTGNFSVIGGYVRDFYLKAAAHYGVKTLDRRDDWLSEPHVDEDIFSAMLKDAGVTVYFHERLREKRSITFSGKRISSITTLDGKQWRAKVFVDSTYEGDLMAFAHVSYAWGRESTTAFGEDLAGVRPETSGHQFNWPISAYDDHHRLLPEIDPGPLSASGTGDKKIESYNFRLILTNDPSNRIPFPCPKGYDSGRFALLARYLNTFAQHRGRAPDLHDIFLIVPIPNHKADFNNNGPFSTDYIGRSWKYPEASYVEKAAIWQDHLLYTQSLMYFVANDPSVPASVQEEARKWGLPKDEYADTDHWPFQLYVREARRMQGLYVMQQSDVQKNRSKDDSIGMGSYTIDSHNSQRVAMPDGNVLNEGNTEIPIQPYEIPYSILTPKKAEAENLLVTVCLSSTHIAYSTLRMEPQYMIAGEAAGEAAALAISEKSTVQDISTAELQKKLRAHGAILHPDEEIRPNATPAN